MISSRAVFLCLCETPKDERKRENLLERVASQSAVWLSWLEWL